MTIDSGNIRLIDIINAADDKFGQVKAIKGLNANSEFVLLISRYGFCNPETRFMTIKAGIAAGEPVFMWGHYDLSYEEAMENFEKRAKGEYYANAS